MAECAGGDDVIIGGPSRRTGDQTHRRRTCLAKMNQNDRGIESDDVAEQLWVPQTASRA
jgi:hypothetical protein